MIRIRILKTCDEFFCKPVGIIFRSGLEKGNSTQNGKELVWSVSSKNNKE